MAYKLKVTLEGNTYPINLHNCGGCEFCTIGECGWFCDYDPLPTACAWPEDVIGRNPMAQDGPGADEEDQMRLL